MSYKNEPRAYFVIVIALVTIIEHFPLEPDFDKQAHNDVRGVADLRVESLIEPTPSE